MTGAGSSVASLIAGGRRAAAGLTGTSPFLQVKDWEKQYRGKNRKSDVLV